MFEVSNWFLPTNPSDRQKQVTAIELPYKCGQIEAEIIADRFVNHEKLDTYLVWQPQTLRILP